MRAFVLGSFLTFALVSHAQAAAILDETFSTDATQGQLSTLYPDWQLSGSVLSAGVSGGVFHLSASVEGLFTYQPSLPGAWTLETLINADPGGSFYNVGVQLGQNNVVFHPGHPGTALRVEGPGGFGNTDIGFTLQPGAFHTLQVVSDGLGLFTVTLIDQVTPTNQFTAAFTNAGSVGGSLSLRVGPNNGIMYVDRFTISTGPSVPEPSAVVMVVAACLLAGGRSRRARRPARTS